MFVIDGVVYAVDPPPGESKWGYGPTVFLLCLVRAARRIARRRRGRRNATEIASSRASRPRACRFARSRRRKRRRRARESRRGRGGTRPPRARSREVYEETTRGATGDDEGRIDGAARTRNHSRRLTVRDALETTRRSPRFSGARCRFVRRSERTPRRAHAPARDEDARRVDVAEHGRVDDDDGDERDDEDYAKRNDDESAPRRRCCNF